MKDNIGWIIKLLNKLIESRFTGSVTINFYDGNVADIHKKERLVKAENKNIV